MLTSKEFTDFLFEAYDLIEGKKKEQARALLTEKLLSLGLSAQENIIEEWIALVENGFHNLEEGWKDSFLMEKLENELAHIHDALLHQKMPKKEKEVLQAREQEILLIIQNWQDKVMKNRDAIAINPPKSKVETLANMLQVNLPAKELSGIEAWVGEIYNRRHFQYAHSKISL